ncbi:hypothetical protein PS15p_201951 [Mucor circinelloides]
MYLIEPGKFVLYQPLPVLMDWVSSALECLKTSDNCPICRKYIYSSYLESQQPFYRVYLTTVNDEKSSSAKECQELKEKLEAANVRLSTLQTYLNNANLNIATVGHNYKSAMKTSKAYKARLDAALKELETLKTSNKEVQQQIKEKDALIIGLEKSKKTLMRHRKEYKDINETLKEHIVNQDEVLVKQYYLLTNKSNCFACKKLRSPHDNDNEVDEWKSTPKNLDDLSHSQLRKQYNDVQKKYDCLAAVHREMSRASAGLTESAKVKLYIKNLKTQLKESKTREVQLKSFELEADLEQVTGAKLALFDQKNQVEESFNRALKAILVLQNQKEESAKENSDLQEKLTEVIDSKLILQKQLKASKCRARKFQNAKTKAEAENQDIMNKMNLFAVQYSSFEKAFRSYFANTSDSASNGWTLTA